MIRVADYIANFLHQIGVHDVFFISGGGMMFLSDGLANKREIRTICSHHEQATAMAAVAYAKYSGKLGVAYLTTGCGGTNAITGVLGAWQDSVPCLFISGQSKRRETVRNSGLKLRQFGVQEADIIAIVESITKYSIMVNDPYDIAFHLDRAVWLALNGRPGPVWLDIPLDVQSAIIDEASLQRFVPSQTEIALTKPEPSISGMEILRGLLKSARRPIVLMGHGIRLANAVPEFVQLIERLNIPVVASRLGIDILPSDHDLFIGRIGTKGDRAGNFALQNADLVLAIGSRLSVSSTGHEYESFARDAKVVVVDIDLEEHRKNTVRIDCFIHSDAKKFIGLASELQLENWSDWTSKCLNWKKSWPVCRTEYAAETDGVNLYYFTDRLSHWLKDDSVVVADAGSAFYVASQGLKLRAGQRFIPTAAQAEMGNTLPAAIGVSIAKDSGDVIGITGDGSFQMNIQELQTIVHYRLPIKIFVWNNDGYLSIRATQRKFFKGRYIGTDSTCGVSFPSSRSIANAYGIKYIEICESKDVDSRIKEVLESREPVICDVRCMRDQEIVPTTATTERPDGSLVSRPLEDMYPFLDREEFFRNMIVKPLDQ